MHDEVQTVPVTLELDPHTATALEDPATRARIEHLIQEDVRKARADELMVAIAALKQEAHRRGLTDQIVDEELAAYNAERRGTPPRA